MPCKIKEDCATSGWILKLARDQLLYLDVQALFVEPTGIDMSLWRANRLWPAVTKTVTQSKYEQELVTSHTWRWSRVSGQRVTGTFSRNGHVALHMSVLAL